MKSYSSYNSNDEYSYDGYDGSNGYDGYDDYYDDSYGDDDDEYYGDEDELIEHSGKKKSRNKHLRRIKFICFSYCPRLCSCFGKMIKILKDFFTSAPDEHIQVKNLLGFPFGAALGFGLYHIVIAPMSLPLGVRQFLGGVLCLGAACGYALSVQMRCMMCLLLPTFFGKTGRSYIAAYAVVFLVTGPIHCIILNGKEVARSLSCTAELSINHTATKWELSMKPMSDVMLQFQSEGLYINKVIRRIDQAFSPMKKEVTDESEEKKAKQKTKRVDRLSGGKRGNRLQKIERRNKVKEDAEKSEKIEAKYKKKLEYRCEDVWNHGVLKCRQKFHNLESRCRSAIPIIGYLLCLPFKMTFFCELLRVIPGAIGMECDAVDVINPGFGQTYVASQDMVVGLEQSFEVNLQYKIEKTTEEIDYTTAEEVRKGTMYQFQKKQILLEFLMTLLQRFMAFTFILVFISAYKYNKKYLTDFRFDNIYITAYFRHIDARRKKKGKKILLPLKKAEAKEVIFPSSATLMQSERKKLTKGTFMLLMRVLVATVIIMSNDLLYNVLDIIRRHSRIDYRQQGEHMIDIDIYGKGFMSEIVRLFLTGFNHKQEIDQITTNFECLPKPVKLQEKYVVYTYIVFGVVWFLMLFESYGLRLRRVISAFFYRKREKRRVLYLYNEMMKKRRGYLRHMRHHIRKQAKHRRLTMQMNIFVGLRQKFPRLCCCLSVLSSAKMECLICNDPERNDFHRCQTAGCHYGYCAECWFDLKNRCFACMPDDGEEEGWSELSDDDIVSAVDD